MARHLHSSEAPRVDLPALT